MKNLFAIAAIAAMFVACGNTETKPATEEVEAVEVEAPVEVVTPVLTAEDSAAVAAMFEGQEVADSLLQAAYDSILAAKTVVEEVAADAAEAVEGAIEEVAGE